MYLNIVNTKTLCIDLRYSRKVSSFYDTSATSCVILWWQVIKEENRSDCLLQNKILQFHKHKATSSQNSSKSKHKQSYQVKQAYHISIVIP